MARQGEIVVNQGSGKNTIHKWKRNIWRKYLLIKTLESFKTYNTRERQIKNKKNKTKNMRAICRENRDNKQQAIL